MSGDNDKRLANLEREVQSLRDTLRSIAGPSLNPRSYTETNRGPLVGIIGQPGATSGTGYIAIFGDTLRLVESFRTPSSGDPGNEGEFCADATNIYFYLDGAWRFIAHSTVV